MGNGGRGAPNGRGGGFGGEAPFDIAMYRHRYVYLHITSTQIGSQQKQSPEDNTGGARTNTSASRCNHVYIDREI